MRSVIANGTDVSYYQGKSLNWDNYIAGGYTFTIIKCSIKSSSGPINGADYFDLHFENSGKAGVKRGVYHFARGTTEAEAIEEANFVINMLTLRHILPGDIPLGVWYDQEDSTCRAKGKDNLFKCMMAFMRKINEAGYGCGLYTNKDWLTNTWDYKEIKNAHIPIWMAQYNSTITFKDPNAIDIWQYTSTGSVPGIVDANGKYVSVDTNRLYTPIDNLFSGQELGFTGGELSHWVNENGVWYYFVGGKKAKSKWVCDKNVWYYLGEDGAMYAEKWLHENNVWYYFNSDGSLMGTGWKWINSNWYYFIDGKMQTGWITEDNGYKAYMLPADTNGCPEGSAAIGLHFIDGKFYAFNHGGGLCRDRNVTLKANKYGELSFKYCS